MKKKRLRYSELAADAPAAPAAGATPEPEAELAVAAPRPKRHSTPVELARALAAARAAEAAGDDSTLGALVGPAARAALPAIVVEPEIDQTERPLRERLTLHLGVVELLQFRVGVERFAVELLAVEEVIDLPVIHYIPEMPPAMLGVITVRGCLTPVYTPHRALGLPVAPREAVLIFRKGRARVGVLIDDVDDAISLDLREMRDAPSAESRDAVILGVVLHENALVAIVDAGALINACQAAALLEVA